MKFSRVLIIDDSLTIRAMVKELLSAQAGCRRIEMAADVVTARTLLEDFRPSVITLDLNMPGIGGLSFLDELRSYPHAPVVVLSSSTKDGSPEAAEALAHGAEACFDKARILKDTRAFLRVLAQAAAVKTQRFDQALRLTAPAAP